MAEPVIHSFDVRYFEVDSQGVVFNGWYLGYFDEAMYTFLTERGLPYQDMIAAGYDVHVVHTEMDWMAGVGYRDNVEVAVSTARIGRTSFALDFELRRNGSADGASAGGSASAAEVTCSARSVYVLVATDGSGKQEIPPLILAALGEPAPLRPA